MGSHRQVFAGSPPRSCNQVSYLTGKPSKCTYCSRKKTENESLVTALVPPHNSSKQCSSLEVEEQILARKEIHFLPHLFFHGCDIEQASAERASFIRSTRPRPGHRPEIQRSHHRWRGNLKECASGCSAGSRASPSAREERPPPTSTSSFRGLPESELSAADARRAPDQSLRPMRSSPRAATA